MISLVYSKTGSIYDFVAVKFPEAKEIGVIDESWVPSAAEAEFLHAMGIDVDARFIISNLGSGARNLIRVFSAWRREPDRLHFLLYPEASLHPGIQPLFFEWLMTTGRWVAVTHSELFLLRGSAMIRDGRVKKQQLEVFVVDDDVDSAVDQLASAVEGVSTYTSIKFDDQGQLINSWPGGFFTERMSELL